MESKSLSQVNISGKFYLPKYLIPCLVFLFLCIIYSIPNRAVNADEGWISETAYHIVNEGAPRSDLMFDLTNNNISLVVFHRLYVYLESVSIFFFGYSLSSIRLVSLVFELLTLILFWKFAKYNSNTDFRKQSVLLSIAIFLAAPVSLQYSYIARPEVVVTLLGFASFFFLCRRCYCFNYIIAGLIAGAAMLTHMNGVVYVATGFVFLLFEKSYRKAALFALSALVAFLPYIIPIISNYDLFLTQMRSPLILNKTDLSILRPFTSVFSEHQRLFRNYETIPLSILIILSFVTSWKSLISEHKQLTIYTLILFCVVGMIVEDKTSKYSFYTLPFSALIIAYSAPSIPALRPALKRILSFAICLFAASSLISLYTIVSNKEYPSELNNQIASQIPKGSTVIAPMNFLFNELPNYRTICNYRVRMDVGEKPSVSELYRCCNDYSSDYIVLNKYGERIDDPIDLFDTVAIDKYFTIVAFNDDFQILKRR